MSSKVSEFKYFHSCDIELNVLVKVAHMEGNRPMLQLVDALQDPYLPFSGGYYPGGPEPYVTCQIYADGLPIGLPARTSYKATLTQNPVWNEWLTLPVKYKDLPHNAMLVVNVWDVYGPRKVTIVGGTTYPLFGKFMTLKKGKHKLRLWPQEADVKEISKTPGKWHPSPHVRSLQKLLKKYESGEMERISWMDDIALRQVQKTIQEDDMMIDAMRIYIEFPPFEYDVLYQEKETTDSLSKEALYGDLIFVHDPDLHRVNPVEAKHRKLARSLQRSLLDRDLKPNATERNSLNMMISSPCTRHFTPEEKDLMWKFRNSLIREKKALTKFLKCVDWQDIQERDHALELMRNWEPIHMDDALELLSSAFTNEQVRIYAVQVLQKTDDEELSYYLLQLVQAIRYETKEHSELVQFLIDRSCACPEVGIYFHWYLTVECEDKTYGQTYSQISELFMNAISDTPLFNTIKRQISLVGQLKSLARDLKQRNDNRTKKIERLQQALSKGEYVTDVLEAGPLSFPLHPKTEVVGVFSSSAFMFKSALCPMKLEFKTVGHTSYNVIYKSGDDMRQDQLIVQIIALMDRLLKKENLDLKLTPYRVLATSNSEGMAEFVESMAVRKVLDDFRNDIQIFLKAHNPDSTAEYGIKPFVLDNFVRSCAGYCVITYILGIGDRHLDNLMLTKNGNLFHIDFGFIFGRDPKPFPPPMKLCKEMVEAMGGANSRQYQRFQSLCSEAYIILRRSSNLILNLLNLMIDANIPDISSEPDKSILKVQEKFRLDLNDEEAVIYFQTLIYESVSAYFPQMVETIHKMAQYIRN